MGTVIYDGTSYSVYGLGATEAETYIKAAAGSASWMALDDDGRAKMLVAAFRYLERQKWNSSTAGSFAVRDAIAGTITGGPGLFAEAQYEMAMSLASNESINSAKSTGSNVKRVDAKGVSVEFFRATDALATSTPLPTVVMDLVGTYLSSTSEVSNINVAYNTARGDFDDCKRSSFDDCASFDRDDAF